MRAVMRDSDAPPFEDAAAFVAGRSPFRLEATAGDWSEFEVIDSNGETVLEADLWTGGEAREELRELEEFLDQHDGDERAREAVKAHLRNASAIVAMQVLMSRYDESVAAANAIIDYLEQRPGVLTQVDTLGWYDGSELILREPE